jgi:hypothetical protein
VQTTVAGRSSFLQTHRQTDRQTDKGSMYQLNIMPHMTWLCKE